MSERIVCEGWMFDGAPCKGTALYDEDGKRFCAQHIVTNSGTALQQNTPDQRDELRRMIPASTGARSTLATGKGARLFTEAEVREIVAKVLAPYRRLVEIVSVSHDLGLYHPKPKKDELPEPCEVCELLADIRSGKENLE